MRAYAIMQSPFLLDIPPKTIVRSDYSGLQKQWAFQSKLGQQII